MTQNKNNVSNNKISFKIKKHEKDNPKVKNEKFNKKTDTHKILDTIEIGKNTTLINITLIIAGKMKINTLNI